MLELHSPHCKTELEKELPEDLQLILASLLAQIFAEHDKEVLVSEEKLIKLHEKMKEGYHPVVRNLGDGGLLLTLELPLYKQLKLS